jgi:hypothetical protein
MNHTPESLLTLAATDDGKQQIRVMVAELCGWKPVNDDAVPDRVWPCKGTVTGKDGWWMMFPPAGLDWGRAGKSTGKVANYPPEYTASLDAIIPAVLGRFITREDEALYARRLTEVLNEALRGRPRFLGASSFDLDTAQAVHCAIAFILTIRPKPPNLV